MLYKDIRSYIKPPDLLSIGGLIFSVAAIFLALQKQFAVSYICILISTLFDYSDGKLSRKMKREGRFGTELDNLCDVVLYLVSIVIFAYSVGLTSTWALFCYTLFIITGILRLARFATTGIVKGGYSGLPVFYSILIPGVYFAFVYFGIPIVHILWLFFIPSFLMISTIKVKKY